MTDIVDELRAATSASPDALTWSQLYVKRCRRGRVKERKWKVAMPRVTALNLRESDDLAAIERALKSALASLPEMMVSIDEIDLVPIRAPAGFDAATARIDVDLWERSYRTREALQETASKAVVGDDQVKVVLKPYDIEKSGWVSS